MPRHAAQDIVEAYLSDANQARDFLNYVDQRAGLLIGRPSASGRPDAYTFPHRTFQEYLAGCYLLMGSDVERWEELATALRRHAADHDALRIEASPFGTRYIIEGILPAPDGRALPVRTVWFIETGERVPRLVTAYPLRRRLT